MCSGRTPVVFSQMIVSRPVLLGWEIERGRPLAARADASTAAGRAQRGAAREREGAFGNAAITADVRYSLVTKHYRRPGHKAHTREASDEVMVHRRALLKGGATAAAVALAGCPATTDESSPASQWQYDPEARYGIETVAAGSADLQAVLEAPLDEDFADELSQLDDDTEAVDLESVETVSFTGFADPEREAFGVSIVALGEFDASAVGDELTEGDDGDAERLSLEVGEPGERDGFDRFEVDGLGVVVQSGQFVGEVLVQRCLEHRLEVGRSRGDRLDAVPGLGVVLPLSGRARLVGGGGTPRERHGRYRRTTFQEGTSVEHNFV